MLLTHLNEVYVILAQPKPVLGLALSRIALGSVFTYDGLRMLREHDAWYGRDALRAPRSALPAAVDAFAWAERLGGSSRTVLRVATASAILFACGLATEVSGAVLLVCLVAVIARNTFVAYGGDVFGCAVLLLLLCSPCGAAASVDRFILDGSLGLNAQASLWGGQLLRIEVAFLYLGNFLAKVRSRDWRRGTVMFDLLKNRNFARADVPRWLTRRDVARLATWGALAAELAFGPALLFPPTATFACVAAMAFHLTIAWLVDVHLFSALMIAALLACWPTGTGTLPPPPLDSAHSTALVFALCYLAWAVLCDLPVRRDGRLAGALARFGAVRGWRMFTTSTPFCLSVEITVLDAHGGTAKWTWGDLDDLWNRQPARRGHRFQRFQQALLRDARARQRLRDGFRAGLHRGEREVRAWLIDVLVVGVHGEAIVAGVNVGAQVALTAVGTVDRAACQALAAAVRLPATGVELSRLSAIEATTK
jgi:uncharacterized membrane protein YphA (DoxX/SURF4 family)